MSYTDTRLPVGRCIRVHSQLPRIWRSRHAVVPGSFWLWAEHKEFEVFIALIQTPKCLNPWQGPNVYKQVPSRLPWVHALVLEIDFRPAQSNTNQSGSTLAGMYHDVSSRLFRLIPKWSFSYFILQPGPGHLGRSPSATCRCPAWVASRVQLAPGLVAASDVLVFHLLQRKSGTLLAGILVLTCFFFHLLKPAHHASTFVVFAIVHPSCQIHMFSFHRFHHVSPRLICTCAPCFFYTMETRAF